MDITIETLQYCFVCDEEMYAGKQRFVDDEMTQLMNLHGTEAKNNNEYEVHARAKGGDDGVFQDYEENINIPEPEPEIEDEEEEQKKKKEADKKVETPPEFAPVDVDMDELEGEEETKQNNDKNTNKEFQEMAMDDLFGANPASVRNDQREPSLKINIPKFGNNTEESLFHGGELSEEPEQDKLQAKKPVIVKPFSEISGLDILGTSSRDVSGIDDSRAGDLNKKLFNSSKLKIEEAGSDSEDEEDVDINQKDIVNARKNFVF